MGKLRVKFVSSNFDRETGISVCTVKSKEGVFTAKAKLHNDDIAHASEYAGCSIAHTRAVIKAYECRINKKKKEVEDINRMYSNMTLIHGFNKKSPEATFIRKYMADLTYDIAYLGAAVKALNDSIVKQVHIREQLLKKVANKNEKKALNE